MAQVSRSSGGSWPAQTASRSAARRKWKGVSRERRQVAESGASFAREVGRRFLQTEQGSNELLDILGDRFHFYCDPGTHWKHAQCAIFVRPTNVVYQLLSVCMHSPFSSTTGIRFGQCPGTRRLVQRYIGHEKQIGSVYIIKKLIHIQDVLDSITTPSIGRVAPLAQILQGRNQFYPEGSSPDG